MCLAAEENNEIDTEGKEKGRKTKKSNDLMNWLVKIFGINFFKQDPGFV